MLNSTILMRKFSLNMFLLWDWIIPTHILLGMTWPFRDKMWLVFVFHSYNSRNCSVVELEKRFPFPTSLFDLTWNSGTFFIFCFESLWLLKSPCWIMRQMNIFFFNNYLISLLCLFYQIIVLFKIFRLSLIFESKRFFERKERNQKKDHLNWLSNPSSQRLDFLN